MALASGTRLGSFEITGAVGAGGMGEVYRARDTKLGRDVALKILPEAFAADPDRLMRFEREARTLASLNHPSIAQVYGIEDSTATRALVMELVEGEDLSVRIARGPIPRDEALPIARQIVDALEVAHGAGIIHRDLKPANIKVREDGTVKVLDFGLAKALDPGSATGDQGSGGQGPQVNSPTITSPAMTMRGVILGTAAYMSPEQAKGRPVDKRADIWAFGCVLYEMLSGMRAFEGEDVTDTLALVLRGEPDWTKLPVSLPPALATLTKRCLDRDVRRRIGDMSAVRFVLDELGALSTPASQPADASQADARIGVAVTQTRWRTLMRTALPLLGVAIAASALSMYVAGHLAPAPAPRDIVRFQLPLPEGQVLSLARRVAALSPDGRELAYVTDTRLFVRRLSEFDAAPVAAVETGQSISSPVYSPDGAWLAFHSGTERAIKRVSTRGGLPVRVCEMGPPSTIAWDASGILAGTGSEGIQRCNPAGGAPEMLVEPRKGETLIAPQILPGGKTIIYTAGQTADVPALRWERSVIVAQSLETGERRTIVEAGADGQYLETGHLIYRLGGILYAAPFDPATLERRGEPAPVIDGIMRGTNGTTQMALSSNGTLVFMPGAVGVSGNERELAVGDRTGVITRLPLTAGPFVVVRVNRDGTRATLGSDNGKDAIVWVYELDGQSAARRLTLEGQNRFPLWSPDGRWITFQSDRAGDAGLYRQRADGTGGAERLTTAPSGAAHIPESWSPDGRQLAFSVRTEGAQGPSYALHILTVADGRTAPLGKITSREPIGAVFSPDGRWFAYASTQSDDVSAADRGIFVQPFPPSGAVFQVPRQLVDFHPLWSTDGKEIVFLASTNARLMAAVRVTVNGGLTFGAPTRFPASVTGDRLSAEPRSFDLLPDGRLIGVVTRTDSGRSLYSELRVVLNWVEELDRRVPTK